jgi:hypothetical protein
MGARRPVDEIRHCRAVNHVVEYNKYLATRLMCVIADYPNVPSDHGFDWDEVNEWDETNEVDVSQDVNASSAGSADSENPIQSHVADEYPVTVLDPKGKLEVIVGNVRGGRKVIVCRSTMKRLSDRWKPVVAGR